MPAVHRVGFVMHVFGPPTKSIGGCYCCAKVGCTKGAAARKTAGVLVAPAECCRFLRLVYIVATELN